MDEDKPINLTKSKDSHVPATVETIDEVESDHAPINLIKSELADPEATSAVETAKTPEVKKEPAVEEPAVEEPPVKEPAVKEPAVEESGSKSEEEDLETDHMPEPRLRKDLGVKAADILPTKMVCISLTELV